MCDEYEDERMVAFWRKLEEMEPREKAAPEAEGAVEPLLRIEPNAPPAPKAKPRALTR